MSLLAIQTIRAAKESPCPPIQGRAWAPPPLFAQHKGLAWRVSGKRELLDNKPSGQPRPILLGPLFLERAGVTEKKWTLSTSLHLPEAHQEKYGQMHAALREWLAAFYEEDRLFLSRWKSDYRGARRAALRWWKAKGGKFERTTEPAGGLIFPVIDKFTRSGERIYIEVGMDVIVV